jgi:hypothetical protein
MDRTLGDYEGLAVVVMADGIRYPCRAEQRGQEMVRISTGEYLPTFDWWRGTIELDDDRPAGMIEAAEYAVLEVYGRSAKFRVTGRWGRRLGVHSNGSSAPFD